MSSGWYIIHWYTSRYRYWKNPISDLLKYYIPALITDTEAVILLDINNNIPITTYIYLMVYMVLINLPDFVLFIIINTINGLVV